MMASMVNGGSSKNQLIQYTWVPFLCSLVIFFAFYSFINYVLFDLGIIHPHLMLFSEKALLVLRGIPPRLENFGFIYPPLPIFLVGLFNGNVLLAQSFVASLISTLIAFHIRKTTPSLRQAFPLIVFMTFSFPVLFLATQRFDLYLYFFLVVLSAKLLYQFKKEQYALDLFCAGPLFGAAFFTHFSSIYLLPVFFFLIWFFYEDQPQKIIPISLTFFTPFCVSFFIFAYVNYLFTGEAFGFLIQYHLLFSNSDVASLLSSGGFLGDITYILKYVLAIFPAIIPYFLGMYHDRNIVLVLPFMILFSLFYSTFFFPAVYFSAVFLIHFLLMTQWSSPVRQKVLLATLCVSFFFSPAAALFSEEPHEKRIAQALWGIKEESNLSSYQAMAALFNDHPGKILLDDLNGYPLVYLMKTPERFILPYQFEFATALSNPAQFVHYVVAWKDKNNDFVFQRFGHHIEQFRKRFEDEKVIIWERAK